MLSRPAHHMLNAIALRHFQFMSLCPQCCAIAFIDASDDQLNAALCSAVLRSPQAHRQKLPVEAKYNPANDKANFARIRGLPST